MITFIVITVIALIAKSLLVWLPVTIYVYRDEIKHNEKSSFKMIMACSIIAIALIIGKTAAWLVDTYLWIDELRARSLST